MSESGDQLTGNVLITDYAWPDLEMETRALEAAGLTVIQPAGTSEAELVEAAGDVDAIMTNWAQVTQNVIAASGRCQQVSRMGIGLDNIDVDYCTQHDIPVTNVPDYCVDEVAEHALALILALGRQIHHYHHETKQGIYELGSGQTLFRLKDQTVGIIGLGNTGRALAHRCMALGFQVLIASRSGQSMPGTQTVALEDLLRSSDFISLHLPLNESTRHYIGESAFRLMKPTAYLINTARGGVVDHQALARALDEGRIAGAGLDVQVPEPPDLDQTPYNDPRVIVTPHAAFVSEEALANLRQRSAQQIIDRLAGRTPENIVNDVVIDG